MLHAFDKLKVSAQFFSKAELQGMEAAAKGNACQGGQPTAAQLPSTRRTHSVAALKRTKMFFGARCEPLLCSNDFTHSCYDPHVRACSCLLKGPERSRLHAWIGLEALMLA